MNGKDIAKRMAEEICSVQPMPSDMAMIMKTLYESGKSEKELKEQGYKPVSSLGLLWVKDDRGVKE